jgi:pyruvate/2-oxoacid:ferredoxin oxidoreductase beta subunit
MATASVGYPKDFQDKVLRARDARGPTFVQVHAPCPAGWRYESKETIRLARMAVECGMWKLFESRKGEVTISRRPKAFAPIDEYLRLQGRFSHLTKDELAEMQAMVDADVREFYGIEGDIPRKAPAREKAPAPKDRHTPSSDAEAVDTGGP